MNILMYFRDDYSNFSFDNHVFIAGGNGTGKTMMYNHMLSGFDGKEKDMFLVDGLKIKKSQFVALGISRDNTLDEEIKLSSKTYILSRLEAFREYVSEEKIRSSMFEYFDSIKELIEKEIFSIPNFNIEFDFDKISSNIFKAIEYKIDDINFSELSTSEKVNIQLEIYLNRLIGVNDNTVLLIDDFDSIYTKNKFFEKVSYILSKIKDFNTKCIFFVKNEDIVYELVSSGHKVLFIDNNKLVELPRYINFIDEVYLYSEKEIENKIEKIRKEKEFDIIKNYLK
ncbi:hypothetical protein CEP89_06540 [Streptobacillus moniliformis]|uniref:ABC transporter domain-containing protein n=1 Tax=Streptobacillus moniliformis (strain ATCC 14647 / DSM 12112 / NCTC 10651 / 9901) TaxID=519441 RepID=D1AUW3_STRM9|nr:hypothetical protein [Streptobacillus moniliformis]ACZ01523.1 hypothetical protein Smon_1060 [Streptobacillus moniliformis DSM 12112]AVL43477.1 hypothetical protein CEP89_06540 [Streptobacillus moniliformis]SQA13313.1 Uncharacterised protein [Streptobacillus moniliformis]